MRGIIPESASVFILSSMGTKSGDFPIAGTADLQLHVPGILIAAGELTDLGT